ncbi:MAG TPA: c-type cytochrome [Gaiellaceae bacterium]|jgi:cytochrome c2|nr:c-type cytochrome [Gaiellaceae bacterium]
MRRLALIGSVGIAILVAAAACGPGTEKGPIVKNGDAARGKQLIGHYGCGSCHTIGGVSNANANVGPDLRDFANGHLIAGKLANTPANLIHWLMDPQQVVPGNDMPDMGIGTRDARDIAAFLYSQ